MDHQQKDDLGLLKLFFVIVLLMAATVSAISCRGAPIKLPNESGVNK